jgi:hypothetical protein
LTQDADRAWAALRRLHEGARPGAGLLALCSGKAESTIRRRAEKEGWKEPADRDAAGLKALRRFRDRLYLEMERLSGSEGDFGKAEYDAINAMTRLIDKINDLTRTEEGANEREEHDDAFLAAAIEKIDRRIIELARELAGRMGEEEFRA